MHLDALLCDAATVRDSLLHILGGGIVKMAPLQYPAPIPAILALQLTFDRI